MSRRRSPGPGPPGPAGGAAGPGAASPAWRALCALWQDKHLVVFKTEDTLLVCAVLWLLEICVNVWVIHTVPCELTSCALC